ncbi:unnamed protein product [Closterium sp. Yama58-4]|nr:unnamed protein product [Closterium sp. Yama58-4]
MTAQDADDEENPYDMAYLAEDDCDTDSDDKVEYLYEDEEEEGAWGGVILDLDMELMFKGGSESLNLVGYADADDAGDKENRSSTGGYLFKLGGAAVSWQAKKLQGATKLSSAESKLVAAVEAGKEGGKLRFLLWEFQLVKKGVPTTLHVDNMSAVQLSQAGGLQGRMKHVDRRHMWLQDMVRLKKLKLQHIPTTAQPADFFTKRLDKAAFNRCCATVGLVQRALDSKGAC